MSVEEQELHLRAASGDPASVWALTEIKRLVEKNNDATRECWELRTKIIRINPALNSMDVMNPVVVAT